jgi:hypothetical protein
MMMYGYDASAMQSWTSNGVSRNLSQLISGFQTVGLPGLFRIDTLLFTRDAAGHLELVKDWRAVLKGAFDDARPHLCEGGALRGFFIGDELTAQGLPFDDLKMVIDAVHAALESEHSIPLSCRTIYYNDSIFMATWTTDIPHNLTHFSLDYYHGRATGRIGQTVWDLYQSFVLPKLGPTTKLLFVPQAFGSRLDPRSGHTLADYEHWALGNLSEYVRWSALDDRIVGFNPWHLLDRPVSNSTACAAEGFGCCEVGVLGTDESGAYSMPRLRDAIIDLGKEVVANSRRGLDLT